MKIIQSYLKSIAEVNALDIADSGNNAGKWVFHHGMLFLSPDIWWHPFGSKTYKRKTMHEGIDILFYMDNNKQIQNLDTNTLILSATSGRIINICDDFIGKSIIISNDTCQKQNHDFDLIFVYAHILPNKNIKTGMDLNKGDIIAKIAKTDKKKTLLSPHLHFSVIEISKTIPAEDLTWKLFSDITSKINLINPFYL